MLIRNATELDAKNLFEWRNDQATRTNSHNTNEIKYEEHISWLKSTLQNPKRNLYIADIDGVSVGTVRVDIEDNQTAEISWTVSPKFRGKGIAKLMINKRHISKLIYFKG